MNNPIWGRDYNKIKERWQEAQKYYYSVERIYQLESLQSKREDTINSTKLIKTQQQLNDLMTNQLEILSQKAALSEIDVELAEKELEVYKVQIALEEAQNNKNSMKLVRNEQGNLIYQYVVDIEELKAKEQDYLNKINEWSNASIDVVQ